MCGSVSGFIPKNPANRFCLLESVLAIGVQLQNGQTNCFFFRFSYPLKLFVSALGVQPCMALNKRKPWIKLPFQCTHSSTNCPLFHETFSSSPCLPYPVFLSASSFRCFRHSAGPPAPMATLGAAQIYAKSTPFISLTVLPLLT